MTTESPVPSEVASVPDPSFSSQERADTAVERAVAAYEATQPAGEQTPASSDSGQATSQPPPPAEPTQVDPYEPVLRYFQEHAPSLAQKYRTGADALAGAINAQQLIGQRDEYAQWGRQLAEDPQSVYQRLRTEFEPQEQPQASPQPTPPSSAQPQELDPYLLTQVTRDPQSGKWVNLPGGMEGAADRVNEHERHFIASQREMLRDPLRNPAVREQIEARYVPRDEFENLRRNLELDRETRLAEATAGRLAGKLFNSGDYTQGRTHWGNLFVAKLQEAGQLGVGFDPNTNRVNYQLQNEFAERQADLLYTLGMQLASRQQTQPAARAAPTVPISATQVANTGSQAQGGTREVRDSSGNLRLDAMLQKALTDSLARGEITQRQVDEWASVA